jgi:hypothetical protein
MRRAGFVAVQVWQKLGEVRSTELADERMLVSTGGAAQRMGNFCFLLYRI